MSEKPYHHGNLKNELMEKGLKYVSEHGAESFSMRKLAETCGVSSAAPYAHFKNKEDYLDQAREYVTMRFTEILEKAVKDCRDKERLLLELGKNYVMFFVENPHYHGFLFKQGAIDVKKYRPYLMFEQIAGESLKAMGYDDMTAQNKTIAMWAMVQGLSDIYMIDSGRSGPVLEQEIEKILMSVKI